MYTCQPVITSSTVPYVYSNNRSKSTPTQLTKNGKTRAYATKNSELTVGVEVAMTGFFFRMSLTSTPSRRGAKIGFDFDTGVLATDVIDINSGPDWDLS